MPKMKKREALSGVAKTRKATFQQTNNENDSLTFVMVSDQNEGYRWDWDLGTYIERLDISGANYEHLNTFFKNHDRDVDAAVGRVENKRVDGTSLLGDVVFDESGADIKRKYENGTLTDVSIGYKINKYEVEEREGEPDIVTVTDFEILELSAVGVGFDKGAKHTGRESDFNEGEEQMLKELLERLAKLEKKAERSAEDNAAIAKLKGEIEAARAEENDKLRAENLELTRKQAIADVAKEYSPSEALRTKFEEKGTPEEFMRAILDEKAAGAVSVPSVSTDENTRSAMIDGMRDAMVQRAGITLKDAVPTAERYMGMNLLAMARSITGYEGHDVNALVERAMTTADFPILLVSAGNRVLQSAFDEEISTFDKWVTQVERSDFKTNTDVSLGSAGRLQKVQENGEFKEAKVDESGESWKLESYGAKFVLTRQMIINDDLGAFNDLLQEFGRMAKRTANGLVYDMLQKTGEFANYKMADNKAIFEASTHKNLGTAAALSETSLEAATTAIKRQKDSKGKALNIIPKFLIVAPEQEITARKLIASMSSTEDNKNSGNVNPFYDSMTVIVDSELAAGAWYVAGHRRTIKVGYLAGTGRKPVVKVNSQSLARTEFEGVFDFGVVAEDHRGLYKNPGA